MVAIHGRSERPPIERLPISPCHAVLTKWIIQTANASLAAKCQLLYNNILFSTQLSLRSHVNLR